MYVIKYKKYVDGRKEHINEEAGYHFDLGNRKKCQMEYCTWYNADFANEDLSCRHI